jgi:repressor LexA
VGAGIGGASSISSASWASLGQELDLDPEALAAPSRTKQAARVKPSRGAGKGPVKKKHAFTQRQGQFLAYIHLYRRLHGQGPAEADMVPFFRVTPPSVHSMLVRLEELGLVAREPGVARSVRVVIPEGHIPELVQQPPARGSQAGRL